MYRLFILLFPLTLLASISQECIGSTTLKFFDVRRTRPVTVEVWYPVDSESKESSSVKNLWTSVWVSPKEIRSAPVATSTTQYPLILLSHGSGGDRRAHTWLAEKLVKNGFIVASIEHFGNTWHQNSPEFFLKTWDRPRDVTFALDRLLTDPTFEPIIDREKIGFSGYSLGGMTGIWIAGGRLMDFQDATRVFSAFELPKAMLQRLLDKIDFAESVLSFQDKRIKAIFAMAPAAWGFSPESLQQIETPVYILATEGDEILSVEGHAQYLARHIPNAKFKLFKGKAGHFVFFNQATEYGKKVLQAWLVQDDESVNRYEIHEETSQLALEFFQETFRLKQ